MVEERMGGMIGHGAMMSEMIVAMVGMVVWRVYHHWPLLDACDRMVVVGIDDRLGH